MIILTLNYSYLTGKSPHCHRDDHRLLLFPNQSSAKGICDPVNLCFSGRLEVEEWRSLQSVSIFHFFKQSTVLSSTTQMAGFKCSLPSALLTFNPLLPYCSWTCSLIMSANCEKTTAQSKVMQRQQTKPIFFPLLYIFTITTQW